MKLMFLTPGTGHFYCGSCLRDSTLAGALTRLGHHVDVVPLYLPMVLEGEASVDNRMPTTKRTGRKSITPAYRAGSFLQRRRMIGQSAAIVQCRKYPDVIP